MQPSEMERNNSVARTTSKQASNQSEYFDEMSS